MEAANELFPFFQAPPGRAGSLTFSLSSYGLIGSVNPATWWEPEERVADPNLSGVVWGLGEKCLRLPDYLRSLINLNLIIKDLEFDCC